MRPGYPVLLEWAWTPYVDNNGKIQTKIKGGYISEVEKFWTKGIENSQIFINDAIFQRRNNKRVVRTRLGQGGTRGYDEKHV